MAHEVISWKTCWDKYIDNCQEHDLLTPEGKKFAIRGPGNAGKNSSTGKKPQAR